jgi:hypothetical protein
VKRVLIVVFCLSMLVVAEAAKLKVRAEPDPEFDFATLHTWAWDPEVGQVIMARTPSDDPAVLKAFVEPRIRTYVTEAMTKKGLTATTADADVYFHYYVLVTINSNGQYAGQFLPSVPYWGLPGFSPATTALEVVTRGSLVLDALLPGKTGERKVVWRGIAQSTVEDIDADPVRDARLKSATAELIKRFPLTKKKK